MNKNIAFVHVNFPDGGVETVTSYISEYLISKGYSVTIFVISLDKAKLIDCHPQTSFIELPNKAIDTEENIDFIAKKLIEKRISVLFFKDIVRNVAYLRSCCEAKLIYTHHSIPLWESTNDTIARKNRAKGSFLKTVEWYLIRYPKYLFFTPHKKKNIKCYKRIYDHVDCFTVLCEEYGSQIAQLLKIDSKTSKIIALHNPNIKADEMINLKKKNQILYVGRFSYNDKRIDRLINIWSLLESDFPNWELLIIGGGAEEGNLKRQAEQLQLKNCKFCGYTTNVPSYLQEASILCLTSTFEGWPLSLTEAQKYGVVPCAFDCSAGVHEILAPTKENGILVKCFKKKEYAAQLAELMRNETLREQIQFNVIEKSKEYDISIIGGKWEKMLEKLIHE